jgi:hypothetical protein
MTYDRFIKREFGGLRRWVKEHLQNLVNLKMSNIQHSMINIQLNIIGHWTLDIEHSTLDINNIAEAILLISKQSLSSEIVRR